MDLQSGPVRYASYRQKFPRKTYRKKNIYLPTEVWVDVFCFPWITRWELGLLVDKIGNRWFAEQLQFYLHEWGKHTLGYLYFSRFGVNGSSEFPQTAMPENIKYFRSIRIDHFDNRVFNFFRRIQSVLTANTKLEILYFPGYEDQVNNARTILGHLLPFIDGIHTVHTDGRLLPAVTSMHDKFHKVSVLDVKLNCFVHSTIDPTMEWLTSSNDEPKLLQLYSAKHVIDQQILETIREQFMEATEPSTFAIVVRHTLRFSDLNCENGIGEKLCGVRNENRREFMILRHQANAEAGEKLRRWVDGNTDKDEVHDGKQCIHLFKPTIGPERIFGMPDLDGADNEEKEEYGDENPSTSKKRRICK